MKCEANVSRPNTHTDTRKHTNWPPISRCDVKTIELNHKPTSDDTSVRMESMLGHDHLFGIINPERNRFKWKQMRATTDPLGWENTETSTHTHQHTHWQSSSAQCHRKQWNEWKMRDILSKFLFCSFSSTSSSSSTFLFCSDHFERQNVNIYLIVYWEEHFRFSN